ncbi:unannotated protein [freshwater metagenome]|uniref:Unannotated protein n=1 Tax=freshwater metagenome TaxID=449393 RepID=A0A6J7U089_9ZZZZ
MVAIWRFRYCIWVSPPPDLPIGKRDGITSYPFNRAISSEKSAAVIKSGRQVGTSTVNTAELPLTLQPINESASFTCFTV